jgi:hypothetical protein
MTVLIRLFEALARLAFPAAGFFREAGLPAPDTVRF